jgi:hypothetical protein
VGGKDLVRVGAAIRLGVSAEDGNILFAVDGKGNAKEFGIPAMIHELWLARHSYGAWETPIC